MLKIRLRRMGKRHRPFYRVVVSDSRDVPTAPAVEELGHYDPIQNPPEIRIDVDRIHHWVGQGAQMSATIKKLVKGYTPVPPEGAEAAAPAPKAAKAPKKEAKKAPEPAPEAAEEETAEAAPAEEAEAPKVEASAAEESTEEAAPEAAADDAPEAEGEDSGDEEKA
jgi:small subunit ribosomal protein S16